MHKAEEERNGGEKEQSKMGNVNSHNENEVHIAKVDPDVWRISFGCVITDLMGKCMSVGRIAHVGSRTRSVLQENQMSPIILSFLEINGRTG